MLIPITTHIRWEAGQTAWLRDDCGHEKGLRQVVPPTGDAALDTGDASH